MKAGHRALLVVMLVGLSVIALGLSGYVGWGPGYVRFTIEFYDSEGYKYANLPGFPALPSNVEVYAQVYALAPPNYGSVVVEVFKGELEGSSLTLRPEGALRDVAEAWVDFERTRSPKGSINYNEAGLELNLWIVDKHTGSVLQRVSYFYAYNPYKLLNGEKRDYTVKVAFDPGEVKVKGTRETFAGCNLLFEWRLKYSVVPELNLTVYGESNIMMHNGAWYVKTPILIIHNANADGKRGSKVLISSSIDLPSMTAFKASIGIGRGVEEKLREGDVTGGLDGRVYVGGIVRGIDADSYWSLGAVGESEWAYVWVWARPVMLFYREYRVIHCHERVSEEYTGFDKVEFIIQDVITEHSGRINEKDLYRILGGASHTPPPSYITDWLLNDTLSEYKYMQAFKPREGWSFITYFITSCDIDFKVVVGSSLASLLETVGLRHLAPLAVMMPIPVSGDGRREYQPIGLGLENYGDRVAIVYMKVSELHFRSEPPWWGLWRDPCYYRIPVFMYFEAR
jgi:hypothetical protein